MKTIKIIVLSITLTGLVMSCKKDTKEPANNNTNTTNPATGNGKIILQFEAMFGDSALVLNSKNYVTANNDTLKISTFKYYISNIEMIKLDNSTYKVPESYYLVNHNLNSTYSFTLNNIPVGQYKGIKMLIGVDSARNVSGVQSGDLDPSKGMFWSWSTGYIMLKLEGTSPQSGSVSKSLFFHIGGYSGTYSALKWIAPSFNSGTANVTTSSTPVIHFKTDASEIFKTPYTINFSTTYDVAMLGPIAKMISDNYADMISVKYISN